MVMCYYRRVKGSALDRYSMRVASAFKVSATASRRTHGPTDRSCWAAAVAGPCLSLWWQPLQPAAANVTSPKPTSASGLSLNPRGRVSWANLEQVYRRRHHQHHVDHVCTFIVRSYRIHRSRQWNNTHGI